MYINTYTHMHTQDEAYMISKTSMLNVSNMNEDLKLRVHV